MFYIQLDTIECRKFHDFLTWYILVRVCINIELSYLIHYYQERPEQPEEGEEQEQEKVQEGEAPGK